MPRLFPEKSSSNQLKLRSQTKTHSHTQHRAPSPSIGAFMDDFRSKSCGDGRTTAAAESTAEVGPTSSGGAAQDLRCHSATYATAQVSENGARFRKGRSTNGSGSQSWRLSDPEMQRKRRVASYKVYTVEGKVKGSLRKSFRWLKDRYSRVVYGWW